MPHPNPFPKYRNECSCISIELLTKRKYPRLEVSFSLGEYWRRRGRQFRIWASGKKKIIERRGENVDFKKEWIRGNHGNSFG